MRVCPRVSLRLFEDWGKRPARWCLHVVEKGWKRGLCSVMMQMEDDGAWYPQWQSCGRCAITRGFSSKCFDTWEGRYFSPKKVVDGILAARTTKHWPARVDLENYTALKIDGSTQMIFYLHRWLNTSLKKGERFISISRPFAPRGKKSNDKLVFQVNVDGATPSFNFRFLCLHLFWIIRYLKGRRFFSVIFLDLRGLGCISISVAFLFKGCLVSPLKWLVGFSSIWINSM